jgi:hypothetical protein
MWLSVVCISLQQEAWMPIERRKIFIGSSSEHITEADWIASILATDHDPLMWYELFQAGDITLPRLIEISNEVDAAILVFSEDDKTESRGVTNPSPRDNVVLEFGLFARAVGLKNAIMCTVGNPVLPIDIAGITRIDISNPYIAKPRLLKWLLSLKPYKQVDPERINIGYFKHADHGSFTSRLGDRLTKAKRIRMMGSGVAILGNPVLADEIMQRTAEGSCDLEIYLANPFSEAVQMRLMEEERGSVRPPDGKRGLLDRLRMLISARDQAHGPCAAKICVCNQYPTFALIEVDEDYFVYPYAYKTLGNFSPVLAFSRNTPDHADIVAFLDRHYELVKQDALDAKALLEPVVDLASQSGDKLWGFAAFFIPPSDSALYRFGSDILGYDVRARAKVQTKWDGHVGRAATFGIHLTVCDALYFRSKTERLMAASEASFICSDFERFRLQDLQIKCHFPDNHSVAITCRDMSGQLEALHTEFVQRIYRRAFASDYTLGNVEMDRPTLVSDRRFMMRRYHAPYVLSEFKPHFTLLSKWQNEETEELCELERLLEREASGNGIEVAELAIMTRDPGESCWSISESIKLGER